MAVKHLHEDLHTASLVLAMLGDARGCILHSAGLDPDICSDGLARQRLHEDLLVHREGLASQRLREGLLRTANPGAEENRRQQDHADLDTLERRAHLDPVWARSDPEFRPSAPPRSA